MVLYSWKKICRASLRSSKECLRILDMLTYKKHPTDTKDPLFKYKEMDFKGEGFLVYPELFLRRSIWVTDKERAQYIALASFRNLNNYLVYKNLTLDLYECPVDQEFFINNRLIKLKNDKIHFSYEDIGAQNGTRI